MKTRKVPVSERALFARINRKLAKDGQVLRKCKQDSTWHGELGNYYIVDANKNFIAAKDCDLKVLGREVGCLSEWEQLDPA